MHLTSKEKEEVLSELTKLRGRLRKAMQRSCEKAVEKPEADQYEQVLSSLKKKNWNAAEIEWIKPEINSKLEDERKKAQKRLLLLQPQHAAEVQSPQVQVQQQQPSQLHSALANLRNLVNDMDE
jgi:hypothetical protein